MPDAATELAFANVKLHIRQMACQLEALVLLIEGNAGNLAMSGPSLADLFKPISDNLFEECERLDGFSLCGRG